MDDDEFERQWRESGEPQETEVRPTDTLSTERTVRTIQVVTFSVVAVWLFTTAQTVLPMEGLAVFVPILAVLGVHEFYRRKETKAMRSEKLTDEDLDRLLGRGVK